MNGAKYIDMEEDENKTHWISDFIKQISKLPHGNYRIENRRIIHKRQGA